MSVAPSGTLFEVPFLGAVGVIDIVLVVVALGGGWVLLQAAIAWLKSVVMRLAFRHAIVLLVTSGTFSLEMLVPGGVVAFASKHVPDVVIDLLPV